MKDVCPNCGAAITDEKCPYCGILFYDFACIDANKPFYMKIRHDNRVWRYKVRLTNAELSASSDDTVFYADDSPIFTFTIPNYNHTIKLEFNIIPENNIIGFMVDTDVIDKDVKPW